MYRAFFIFTIASLFGMNAGILEADYYRKNSTLQYKWATAFIHSLSFDGDERILDVGCGDGKISAYLANQLGVGSVVGIDLSPYMISVAKQNHGIFSNLSFENVDALKFDRKEEFDIAVSFCALHWIVDQKDALKSIHKALKKGGRICFLNVGESISNLGPNTYALSTRKKWEKDFPDAKETKAHYSAAEYRALLEEVGFEVESTQEEFSSYIFEGRKAFVAWLRPLITESHHLPREKQEAFLSDLADEILQKSILMPSGDILVPFVKLMVTGKKR